jgi:hypothetical protein
VFWLFPAINEKSLLYSETPFNYKEHFPFIKQLIYSPFRYGASLPGPYDDISFQIGVANLLLAIITGAYLILSSAKRKMLAFICLASFIFSLFLMNIRSSFLWDIFSLSTYFQFPWRILMFTTFITAFMMVFVKRKWIGFVLVFIAFVNTVSYFVPSEYFNPDDNYYMRRFFANRTISGESDESMKYKNYSEDYLLLPTWVKEKPSKLPSAKIESDTASISNLRQISPYEYEARVSAEKESEVVVNTYFYPGWNVYLDGEKQEIYPLEPKGNIGLNVPKGNYNLKVIWEETISRRVANYISLFSLVFVLFMVLAPQYVVKKNK